MRRRALAEQWRRDADAANDELRRQQREHFQRSQMHMAELDLAAKLLADLHEPLDETEQWEWCEAVDNFLRTYNPTPTMSNMTCAASVPVEYDLRPDGTLKRYPHWPIEVWRSQT